MALPNPNVLLVEGQDDKRVIAELMEKNGVDWPNDARPVNISVEGGWTEIVKPGTIETHLKGSGIRVLGVVMDANGDAQARWAAIRNRCILIFPELPEALPATGLIVDGSNGQRLGVWLMPDNQSRGMMETFLSVLVPQGGEDALWTYAQTCAAEAKSSKNAPYRAPPDEDKARIHTWLAWQDPPGRQLHEAVVQEMLDAQSPLAQPFVGWFKALYGL